ncbi:hypothetical protein CTAYLR_002278 [Chrysophaeum taylorii]|uniref:16S rRNA (uracil(1498)-N(3))-methyltransferase n=1 Tax=Chrysophaeum taylorii TaxID=2483200 RepID=A0AAD7XU42_9STRA|nr:hypothetical protein CTAYLR_002278 [Chrysophaeum taylorii]
MWWMWLLVPMSFSPRRRRLRPLGIRHLNRLMLERAELACDNETHLVLPRDDRRAQHVREHIWRRQTPPTPTLRVGVVDGGSVDCGARLAADGGLVLETNATIRAALDVAAPRPRIDVLLGLPAPLRLKRLLPTVSSLGVDALWLVGTTRVERAFFGSSLLRDIRCLTKRDASSGIEPREAPPGTPIRDLLVEGAEQSGFTAIPKLALVSSLSTALDAIDRRAQGQRVLRCAAHPDRGDSFRAKDDQTGEVRSLALRDTHSGPQLVQIPRSRPVSDLFPHHAAASEKDQDLRVTLAVGAERGWEEPDELLLLQQHGFHFLTLGPRTLRTDVALVALLALLQDRLDNKTPAAES